jgi:transcriptional regulator NrdR family protein
MSEGGPITLVVKNGARRHPEEFNKEKLHASLVSACLSSGAPTGHAESIARRVVDEVLIWLESRPEVTSNDLRRVAAKYLKTYHPDASYLYEHHRGTL